MISNSFKTCFKKLLNNIKIREIDLNSLKHDFVFWLAQWSKWSNYDLSERWIAIVFSYKYLKNIFKFWNFIFLELKNN